MNRRKRVRTWLMKLPGHYDRGSSGECLAAARTDYIAHSGDSDITLEDFAAVLWSVGLKPNCVRNARDGNAPLFRLALPSPSAGDATGALRVIAGGRG